MSTTDTALLSAEPDVEEHVALDEDYVLTPGFVEKVVDAADDGDGIEYAPPADSPTYDTPVTSTGIRVTGNSVSTSTGATAIGSWADADAIEIGVPYSDPGIDGPVIQEAVDVAVRIYEWFAAGTIWYHLGITLLEAALAFIIGSVGGIAIGLAAQGIFSDLFAAISIIFDKPFRRGDNVHYDQTDGSIAEIGLLPPRNSSRMRS